MTMTVGAKRIAVGLAAAIVVVGAIGWLVLRDRSGPSGLEASGTVEATEADLAFRVPGRVAEVRPEEGETVAAGALLASLEASELEAAHQAAVAQLHTAEARLEELRKGSRSQEIASAVAAAAAARRREEEATTEAGRSRRLYEGGAISRQALDRAETALEEARAAEVRAEQALELEREGPRPETVLAQKAQVDQARALADRAEATLAGAVIRAPFAGRVTVRHREPGEVVSPGAPVLTLLDPDDRWVRIYVPEDRIGSVSVGQKAEIRSDTYPDHVYEGHIVLVGSEAEFTPRNVQTQEERTRLVYPVKVRITGDPDFELKPGIPADVRLLAPPDPGAAAAR